MWEVVIKHNRHPDNMPVDGQKFVESCLKAEFIPLALENSHILTAADLKRLSDASPHNDPFDRALIAQAKAESMIFITHDGLLSGYAEDCVMVI